MPIQLLQLSNFRNFETFRFTPGPGLNLVFGSNASGKSSLLEAIFMLSRAKSFRTSNLNKVVRYGTDTLSVFARIKDKNEFPLGIEKSASGIRIRMDSKPVERVSDLSRILPLQIIHPESHKLIEEGPVYRRQFLDWGVFHVEHQFVEKWSRYRHILKQRNAALRDPRLHSTVSSWDEELIAAGEEITGYRHHYVQALQEFLPGYLRQQLEYTEYDFVLQTGWAQNRSFADSLRTNLELDKSRGFTTTGPHRADLKITIDGKNAADKVSRGQQKILVATLLLTQTILMQQTTGRKCILLIDDVAAELDERHQQKFVEVLSGIDLQLFITSITCSDVWQRFGENRKVLSLDDISQSQPL